MLLVGQKYSRLRWLLRVKGLVICFYLGWFGSILQIRTNMRKVGFTLPAEMFVGSDYVLEWMGLNFYDYDGLQPNITPPQTFQPAV